MATGTSIAKSVKIPDGSIVRFRDQNGQWVYGEVCGTDPYKLEVRLADGTHTVAMFCNFRKDTPLDA